MGKFIHSVTWNKGLATIIIIVAVSFFYIATQQGLDYLQAGLIVLVLGSITFGFYGEFDTYLGAIVKVISILFVCGSILYLSDGLADKNMLMIIRVAIGAVSGITILVFIGYLVKLKKDKDLLDNSWLIDTVVEKILHESNDDSFQNTRIITTGKTPDNDNKLRFKSGIIASIPNDELTVGDIIKVNVDKNNAKKYKMDLSAFTN